MLMCYSNDKHRNEIQNNTKCLKTLTTPSKVGWYVIVETRRGLVSLELDGGHTKDLGGTHGWLVRACYGLVASPFLSVLGSEPKRV